MPLIYRISRPGREPIHDIESVEAVEGAIRAGSASMRSPPSRCTNGTATIGARGGCIVDSTVAVARVGVIDRSDLGSIDFGVVGPERPWCWRAVDFSRRKARDRT